MPPEVSIALITTVGGILTAVLVKLNRVGRDASAARDQVQNDHDTNFRDDLDDKHGVVDAKLDAQDAKLDLVLAAVKGLVESDRNQWTAIERLRSGRRWYRR